MRALRDRASSLLLSVESVLSMVSAAAMTAIMVIVVIDVFMRYVFSAPLTWSYDLIGLYLTGTVFFLALSDTLQSHGHIAVDVFAPLIPFRLRNLAQSLGFAASSVLLGMITWVASKEAKDALLADERIAGVVPLPTWVANAVLTLGMGVLVVRCIHFAIMHFLSALTNQDIVGARQCADPDLGARAE